MIARLSRMLKEERIPVVLYESPHRIIKTLNEFNDPELRAVVGRELTKKFETVYRGTISAMIDAITQKGEFVVILYTEHAKK